MPTGQTRQGGVMARIRSIKPEFWSDPDMVALPFETRLFYVGMWNEADDFGVLKDEPDALKLRILPADDVDANGMVAELVRRGKVLRKVAPDGTNVLVIRTFCVHQKIDKRATGRWGHPDTFAEPQPIPTDPAESPPAPTTPALERKGVERNGASSAPAARGEFAESAATLTKTFWNEANPRPAVKFVALRQIVERFLEAGWPPTDVEKALRRTRAFTIGAIEFTLREKAAPQNKNIPVLQEFAARESA